MKWQLSMKVLCETKKPYLFEPLGVFEESVLEFDRLDDMVAFLHRVAALRGEPAFRGYAAQVKRAGEATEETVRRFGKRNGVPRKATTKNAIRAANAKSKATQK